MKPDLELMNDKNWDVRWSVAKKINIEHLPKMMNDEDSGVRCEVAIRIAIKHLPKMMKDEKSGVRYEVAKRIGSEGGAFANEHLPKMMNDENFQIRYEVAKRIDPKFLGEMFGFDFDPEYQETLIRVLSEREDLRRV